jgi:hypothetical protein
MPDRLYLSYSVRGFTEHNMLRHFERLLGMFPFSTQSQRVPVLRIYALEFSEPPLLEKFFEQPAGVAAVVSSAKEFQNADCAYLLEGYWDLWQFNDSWRLTPSPVVLTCFGPLFQNDLADHLRVEFDADSDFLPEPQAPNSQSKVQSNIRGLLRLAHELDNALPVERRRLWTESGEDLVERLQAALS